MLVNFVLVYVLVLVFMLKSRVSVWSFWRFSATASVLNQIAQWHPIRTFTHTLFHHSMGDPSITSISYTHQHTVFDEVSVAEHTESFTALNQKTNCWCHISMQTLPRSDQPRFHDNRTTVLWTSQFKAAVCHFITPDQNCNLFVSPLARVWGRTTHFFSEQWQMGNNYCFCR